MDVDQRAGDIMALGDDCGDAWEAMSGPVDAFAAAPTLANTEKILEVGTQYLARHLRWLKEVEELATDLELAEGKPPAKKYDASGMVLLVLAPNAEDLGPADLGIGGFGQFRWVPGGN